MSGQPRWAEQLPVIGGILAGIGALLLLALGIVAVVTLRRFAGSEPLEVLRQLKPLLRAWTGWVVGGFACLVAGIVLFLAGQSRRRTLR